MSAATGISAPAVHRIWHAFGLKPYLQTTFMLSTDPYFVDKVWDIVGLYLAPPDRALVLRVDDKEPDSGAGPHATWAAVDFWQAGNAHP